MKLDIAAGVAEIRLDRPEKGNALSADEVAALRQALASATADAQVHTVLFCADGKHFCTGFDLSDLSDTTDGALLHRFVQVELLLDDIWRSPVRTVAIARGRTWGAGADLFAACDHRLATADATFRFPGAQFGLVLGTRRLTERVGRDAARRLACEGASLDAPQALQAGLVGRIVDDGPARDVAAAVPPPVSRETVRALRSASSDRQADEDLAALVRSAAAPGLRDRIQAYREQQLSASKGK